MGPSLAPLGSTGSLCQPAAEGETRLWGSLQSLSGPRIPGPMFSGQKGSTKLKEIQSLSPDSGSQSNKPQTSLQTERQSQGEIEIVCKIWLDSGKADNGALLWWIMQGEEARGGGAATGPPACSQAGPCWAGSFPAEPGKQLSLVGD